GRLGWRAQPSVRSSVTAIAGLVVVRWLAADAAAPSLRRSRLAFAPRGDGVGAALTAPVANLTLKIRPMRFSAAVLRAHRHHVGVEVGNDPNRAGYDEKDDQQAEGEGHNVVGVVGSGAEMQKEDEVDADLCKGEHDQPDRYAGRPQQI